MLKKIYIIIIILTTVNCLLLAVAPFSTKKNVLILYPEHHNVPYMKTSHEVFVSSFINDTTHMVTEFLDLPSAYNEKDYSLLFALLQNRYKKYNQFDVVIALGKSSLLFANKYYDELFPSASLLSIQYQQVPKSIDITLNENVRITYGDIPYMDQIKMVNRLHPDLDNLFIITSGSAFGQESKAKIVNLLKENETIPQNISYIDFSQITFHDFKFYKKYNGTKSAYVFVSANQDSDGNIQDYDDAMALLASTINSPTYSYWSYGIGEEIIGGYIDSFPALCEHVAKKANLILNGVELNSLNFEQNVHNIPTFDYSLLKKHNIDIKLLPEGSVVLNAPIPRKINWVTTIIQLSFAIIIIFVAFRVKYLYKRLKQKTVKLTETKNSFNQLFNNSPEFILIAYASDGEIASANATFSNSSVYKNSPLKDIKKLYLSNIFGETILDEITDHLLKDSNIYMYSNFISEDIRFPVEIAVTTYIQDSRKMYQLIYKDLTQSKSAENQLINARLQAEESDNLKSAFLANISHEIRTPINAISGFSGLLKEPTISQEEKLEYLPLIDKNAQKLIAIITDILLYSSLTNNQREIREQPFSINSVIQDTVTEFKHYLISEKPKLQIHTYFSLPTDEAIIKTDKELFITILKKLIDNAIKFTSSGFIECGYLLPSDGKMVFYVRDTGKGIPKENFSMIFDNFVQEEDYTTRKSGGMGLGLPICKKALHLMDGNIWLGSDQSSGTTFYFYLEFNPKTTMTYKDNQFKSELDTLAEKKILVIAEDDDSRKYLKIILKQYRVNVISSNSGKRGLNKFISDDSIDLVLLDFQLSDIDGDKIVKELIKVDKDVNIVIQSSYNLSNSMKENRGDGQISLLTKPIAKETLLKTIAQALSSRK